MKRFICAVLILTLFVFTACADLEPQNDGSRQSSPADSDKSCVSRNAAPSSAEPSADASEVSECAAPSSAEEPTHESSEAQSTGISAAENPDPTQGESSGEASSEEELPANAAITSRIAAADSAGFVSDIPESGELNALRTYLESTDYGYFYCDLAYKGYAAYGCDRVFKAASTCKLPYIKYLCTLADSGTLDPDERIVFEERHRMSGSGIMKNVAAGGAYTVRTLMDYTLRYSDNIAYSMLIERFGLANYLKFVHSLGVPYKSASGYANCTASQMAALLFDAASYNGANLSLMLDPGCGASYNRQIGAELSEYKVMQKFGALRPGNIAYHNIAAVFSPHPYILVIFTSIDYDSQDKNLPFRKLARLTDNLNKALYGE